MSAAGFWQCRTSPSRKLSQMRRVSCRNHQYRSAAISTVFFAAWSVCAAITPAQTGSSQGQGSIAPQGRVALVIANQSYADSAPRTSMQDARRVAGALEHARFSVDFVANADAATLSRDIEQFTSLLKRGDTVFVYYAGQAMHFGDENYLVPIDFASPNASEAKKSTYSVKRMLDGFRQPMRTSASWFSMAQPIQHRAMILPVGASSP